MTRLLTYLFILSMLLAPLGTSAQLYPPIFYPRYPAPPAYNPPSDPVHYPVEIGGHLAFGFASNAESGTNGPHIVGTAGIYGQWNRYGLCPGLDLRVQGNSEYLHGYLVGPRVAYQPRGRLNPFRLYAEALFGKNEFPAGTVAANGGPAFASQSGVMRAGTIGLDLHSDSAFAWRVIEFTRGDFTGIPGSHPQTITTGIVLYIP